MLMISNQVSIDSDGKPKCRLGVGFLQVEKSYTEEKSVTLKRNRYIEEKSVTVKRETLH